MTHPLVNAYIEGRAKFKPTTGQYFDKEKNPKLACDVGAMYWGFYKKAVFDYNKFVADFPEVGTKLVPVPCNHSTEHPEGGYISSIMIHLNDEHDGRSGWTTEKKAAWLSEVLGG